MRAAGAVGLALVTACARPQPIASCDDDLHGVWLADGDRDRRWMILDGRATLEVYPLFPDGEPAPRVIDLERDRGGLRGSVKRRYTQRATACLAKAPATVVTCRGDTLEVVLADPQPPLAYEPCTWGAAAPSRKETWRRE